MLLGRVHEPIFKKNFKNSFFKTSYDDNLFAFFDLKPTTEIKVTVFLYILNLLEKIHKACSFLMLIVAFVVCFLALDIWLA